MDEIEPISRPHGALIISYPCQKKTPPFAKQPLASSSPTLSLPYCNWRLVLIFSNNWQNLTPTALYNTYLYIEKMIIYLQ